MREKKCICCFLIFCLLFISCGEDFLPNEKKESFDSDITKSLAEYVTVKDLKWALTLSKEEAFELGISQKDYEESLKEISYMNESLEKLKKDSSIIIHLVLPDEQIIIRNGEAEYIKNIKTKACYDRYNHTFITSVDVQENQGKYVSFVTDANHYRICIEGKISVHEYSHLGSWQLSIFDDIWKVEHVVMGGEPNREFELEWSMGGVGFPVTLLEWKFFLHYTAPLTGYPTWNTISFYLLN